MEDDFSFQTDTGKAEINKASIKKIIERLRTPIFIEFRSTDQIISEASTAYRQRMEAAAKDLEAML